MEVIAEPASDSSHGASPIFLHLDESNLVVEERNDREGSRPGNDPVDVETAPPDLIQLDSGVILSHHSDLTEPLLATEAYPVHSWENNVALQANHASMCEARSPSRTRPEFLYAKVLKPTRETTVGVFLKNRQDGVYISRLSPSGLMARSNLQPGDRVLAINGVSCICSTAHKVAELIKKAEHSVSIMVYNKHGDPNLVSSCIEKPNPNTRVGVALRKSRGALVISQVHTDGLFVESLLVPGHRCIEINGVRCDILPPADAANHIGQSAQYVTIISRPPQEFAMVLASSCENHRGWWKNTAIAFGLAAGALGMAQYFTA